MTISYEEQLNTFYNDNFSEHGFDVRALHWESEAGQYLRFLAACKITAFYFPIKNFSLLDFGCGLGHLYEFLEKSKFIKATGLDYTGVDINGTFIEEAKKKMPGIKFEVSSDSLYHKKYDFVVMSGLYNVKFDTDFDIEARYMDDIRQLFGITKQGLAVNFNSEEALKMLGPEKAEAYKDKFYFHDKDKVLKNLEQISDNIKIADDYMEQDFTYYLLKKA